MTKLRTPDSIEHAVHQAIGLLSAETIAMALRARGHRVSGRLVGLWSDEDAEQRIALHHALAIDELLIKAGHAPVFGALFERLLPATPVEAATESPLSAAIRVTSEAAQLMDKVEQAMADGAVDPHELVSLRARANDLHRRLAKLLRTLFFDRKRKRG